MIPLSSTELLIGLQGGILSLMIFVWALRNGDMDDSEQRAQLIFEPRDFQLERPWETAAQTAKRTALYGKLQAPEPGEWGGH